MTRTLPIIFLASHLLLQIPLVLEDHSRRNPWIWQLGIWYASSSHFLHLFYQSRINLQRACIWNTGSRETFKCCVGLFPLWMHYVLTLFRYLRVCHLGRWSHFIPTIKIKLIGTDEIVFSLANNFLSLWTGYKAKGSRQFTVIIDDEHSSIFNV